MYLINERFMFIFENVSSLFQVLVGYKYLVSGWRNKLGLIGPHCRGVESILFSFKNLSIYLK